MDNRLVVAFVRTWLPAIVVVGGIALIVIRRDEIALEGGAGIIGAGLAIWLFGFLMRMSVSNEGDRTDEEDARTFYDRTGVWPDDATDEQREREGFRPRER